MNQPTVDPNPVERRPAATAQHKAAVQAIAPQTESSALASPFAYALLFIGFIGYYLDQLT